MRVSEVLLALIQEPSNILRSGFARVRNQRAGVIEAPGSQEDKVAYGLPFGNVVENFGKLCMLHGCISVHQKKRGLIELVVDVMRGQEKFCS